ncbi:MAG: tetratricopeptide repeat protein, partial [Alphaproteobacteria bacterium]
FANDFIRKAVEDRHLSTDVDKVAAHRWLGEWFEGREVTLDVAQERVHQWREIADLSNDLRGFGATLLDVEALMTLYEHQQKNLIIDCWYQLWCEGYWIEIQDITKAYSSLIDQSGSPHRIAAIIADLIATLSEICEEEGEDDYAGAEELYRRALTGYDQALGEGHPETLTIVHTFGVLLSHRKAYELADALLRRALEGREKILGADHPDTLRTANCLKSNKPIRSLDGFFDKE